VYLLNTFDGIDANWLVFVAAVDVLPCAVKVSCGNLQLSQNFGGKTTAHMTIPTYRITNFVTLDRTIKCVFMDSQRIIARDMKCKIVIFELKAKKKT
jgi:hypothetical protein